MLRAATAAMDWFTNQAVSSGSLSVRAVPRGAEPRLPQRGDNARTDMTWIVAVDAARAGLARWEILDAIARQGGKLLAFVPQSLWPSGAGDATPGAG